MKIWALCSWYDEKPEHLREMVESVAPLVDGVIAVDGAYALYPHARATSHPAQTMAIVNACKAHGLGYRVHLPAAPWQGNEVEKRAFMFELALRVADPMRDWLLIMDGDMLLDDGVDVATTRAALEATECHVGEVTFGELAYGAAHPSQSATIHATRFRSLFRAVPGLTVEGTHWIYTVPEFEGRRLMLWHGIDGWHSPEPAIDLMASVCLLHRPHGREVERTRNRARYYERREQACAERVPSYE